MHWAELSALGIDLKGHFSGQIKTLCPWCSTTRKKSKEPCLSVNIDEGVYNCKNCSAKGSVSDQQYKLPPKKRDLDPQSKAYLWFENRGIKRETVDHFKPSISQEGFPQSGTSDKFPTICYNYFLNGVHINTKYKTDSKLNEITGNKFTDEGKWFRMVKDARKVPFNIDSIKDHDYVIFVEGEEECMVWHQVGFQSVVSCPNGAHKDNNNLSWLDGVYFMLEGKKIYLATDMDTPGIKLAEDISRRFPPDLVYRISYPDKDANDTLLGHDEGIFSTLFSEAQPIPIKEITEVGDIMSQILYYKEHGFPVGEKLGIPDLDNLMSWNKGELGVWTGIPTMGKSTFLQWVFCVLAHRSEWKFGIFSPEHITPLIVIRLCEQYIGKSFTKMNDKELVSACKFVGQHFFFYNVEEITDMSMDNLLKVGEMMIRRYGIDALMFDPYTYIENTSAGDSSTERIGKLLISLKLFAVRYDVYIALVCHPRKMDRLGTNSENYQRPKLYDISGSNNFFNTTDQGGIVHREYESGYTQIVIEKVKLHFRGQRGDTVLSFDLESGCYSSPGATSMPVYKMRKKVENSLDF